MVNTDYLYYRVGNFSTVNKLSAIEMAGSDISKVQFYFADHEQDQFTWTTEPEENINDLIDLRVREIREQYAYVALWYSGGYDSQSILDSFIRQGIRLDEIVIYGRKWFEHDLNIEHVNAYNYAQYVKKMFQPWIKINVIFYDHNAMFDFYKQHGTDWIYKDLGSLACFNKFHRASGAVYQKEFREIANTIGRVDINGADKPRVNLYQGKWYSQMPDRALYFFFNSPYELFYISPAATRLYIKQVWLAIRWFESLRECSHEFVHTVQAQRAGGDWYAEWNLSLGRSNVHDGLSRTGLYRSLFMGIGENTYETRDMLDVLKIQDPEMYKTWRNGVDYMAQSQRQNWEEGIGLKTILSKARYIKDFEPKTG